jgi:hypothetical protein
VISARDVVQVIVARDKPLMVRQPEPVKLARVFWPTSPEDNLARRFWPDLFREATGAE